MKKAYTLLSLLTLVLAVGGCGGSSRGLSGDVPVFNTVIVSPLGSNPSTLEVDVVHHIPAKANVRTNWPLCDQLAVRDVCIFYNIPSENFQLTLRVETIRNPAGQPVTPNPSPVLIRSYRISFTGCISGVYQFPVGAVLQPDTQRDVTIQPITQDMKRNLLVQVPYVYTDDSGCQTQFNIFSYVGICNGVANLELELVELNSGIVRRINYPVAFRLSDYQSQGDGCRPF
ncbi:MAG: hypothetical protein N2648_01855 [Aquificaceae bacterium]|nr:hypothetical protein [Aquificaceae bacterium]